MSCTCAKSDTFVVKRGDEYVRQPATHRWSDCSWTKEQRYAWRWQGLVSGNGARAAAFEVKGRPVRLVPKRSTER